MKEQQTKTTFKPNTGWFSFLLLRPNTISENKYLHYASADMKIKM